MNAVVRRALLYIVKDRFWVSIREDADASEDLGLNACRGREFVVKVKVNQLS